LFDEEGSPTALAWGSSHVRELNMQRKNFYLSNLEISLLDEESKRLDIATSDLLRRIIDGYFISKNIYPENHASHIYVSGNCIIKGE